MNDKNVRIVVSAKDNASATLEWMSSKINALAGTLATAFATATVAWAWFAMKSAMGLEQTAVAFETMLGSATQAQAMMWQLSKFAAETPFEFPEIANAGKQLLAFWISAQEIQPTLRSLWDVASGMNIPLGELAEIYGKARVQGRLFWNDINEIQGRGIPLVQELAKQFWVAESEIRWMTEEWKIGFANLEQAFKSLTSEGGQFYWMMAKQSKTMSGLLSTMMDWLGTIWRELVGISDTWEVRVGSMFDTLRTKAGEFLEKIDEITATVIDFVNDTSKSIGIMADIFYDGAVWIYESVTWVFEQLFDWLWISTKDTWFQWWQLYTYITAWAAVVAHYISVTFSGIIGWFKMLSVGLGTLMGWIVNIISMGLSVFAIGVEWVVNTVIGWIRLIQWALWMTQTEFVSFGRDMMAKAVDSFKTGFSEWSDAMMISFKEMTESMAASSQKLDGRLNALSSNFGNSFHKNVIPPLKDTKTKIDEVTWALDDKKGAGKKVDEFAKKVEDAGKAIEQRFSQILGKIDQQKSKLASLNADYDKLKEKLKQVGEEGAKDLAKIDEQLDKQAKKIQWIYNEGAMDIGGRAIEIEKELAEIEKRRVEIAKEWTDLQAKVPWMESGEKNTAENEIIAKQKAIELDKQKLENELKLAQTTITTADMQKAREESAKSETEKIIERTVARLDEAEIERAEILKTKAEKLLAIEEEKASVRSQMEEKRKLILQEKRTYGALIAERMNLDAMYFDAFGKRITEQIDKTKEAISLMNTLSASGGGGGGLSWARADGWPVSAGGTYLVWERWPELFTPSQSGAIIPNSWVTVNIGTISIWPWQDARMAAKIIADEIARQIQLGKKWIYT